jgi:hypothetical protein
MKRLIWAALMHTLVVGQSAATASAQDDCAAAFDDIQNFLNDVYAKSTAEITDGVIPWDTTDWENIVRRVVGTSEFYLNNCVDQDTPLAEQREAVTQFADLSLLQIPVESVDIGGDFADVQLVSNFTPSTHWLDLNGDGVDELILHTQVPYFSDKTVYAIRGGLSIAFFHTADDGWQGQVIAPVTSFVTDEEGDDHLSYAQTQDNTLSVENADEALIDIPAPQVEVIDTPNQPLTAVTIYSTTGAGEAKELDILSWDGRIPSVELRVAFDDWCYLGAILDWEIRNDGSVFIPSNGNEEGSALHCGHTPEALYVWEGDHYALAD